MIDVEEVGTASGVANPTTEGVEVAIKGMGAAGFAIATTDVGGGISIIEATGGGGSVEEVGGAIGVRVSMIDVEEVGTASGVANPTTEGVEVAIKGMGAAGGVEITITEGVGATDGVGTSSTDGVAGGSEKKT